MVISRNKMSKEVVLNLYGGNSFANANEFLLGVLKGKVDLFCANIYAKGFYKSISYNRGKLLIPLNYIIPENVLGQKLYNEMEAVFNQYCRQTGRWPNMENVVVNYKNKTDPDSSHNLQLMRFIYLVVSKQYTEAKAEIIAKQANDFYDQFNRWSYGNTELWPNEFPDQEVPSSQPMFPGEVTRLSTQVENYKDK